MANPTTNISQLEQGRANYAYACAELGAILDKKSEYKSYVKKLPMLIKTNGLGAAIAFAFAKGSRNGVPVTSNPWGVLYIQIEKWITHKEGLELMTFDENRFAKSLTETDCQTYRAVTVEVLALLMWMRRFAEGLIDG
jgi:CRISPR-associated protein Cmr5